MELTQARLKELLHYDPDTGVFTRLVRTSNSVKIGDVAGTASHGYIILRIGGKFYRAHRLAWVYTYGTWPKSDVDHINGLRGDNRIVNLRDVTHSENMHNQKSANAGNAHGHMGVTRSGRKWVARIGLHGKSIYLGTFATAALAAEAYRTAKPAYHPTAPL